jgi:hypothetical protein
MTRFLAIAASTLAIHLPHQIRSADKPAPELAALIADAETRRDSNILEVRSVREYAVRNPRWQTDAVMQATMITSADGMKRYEIQRTNAEGLRRKILIKILDGEVQAAAKRDRDGNINAVNYELRPISATSGGSQTCRTVELVPRKRTRFTFYGRGCVDMKDMAMVRMEGRTAKRMSFLIGPADVVQEFRKVGDFWYSSTSRSSADVRFLGRTELFIRYLDYTITSKTGAIITAQSATENYTRP